MNDEIESDLNCVDSDKSFESCIDPDCQKIDELDDSSVKSFHSCANTKANSKIDGDKNESINGPVEPQEDEDDDDIRPGSCRDHPSSDEDADSCWSDENGDWIYDAEFVEAKRSHEAVVAPEIVPVANEQKPEKSPPIAPSNPRNRPGNARRNNHNNPTFIPTSGRFFMHDLRQNDEESQSSGNYRNSASSVTMATTNNTHSHATGYRRPRNNYRGGGGGAGRGKENRFDSGCSDRWAHDLYDEAEQRPLSHSQLVDKYGDNRSASSRYPRASSKKHQKSINNKRPQINNNINDDYDYDYDYHYYYDYYNNDYYGNYRRGADGDNRYWHSYSGRRPSNHHSRYYPSNKSNQYCGPTKYSDIRITVDVANRGGSGGGGGARSIKAVSNGNEHSSSSSNNNNKSRRPIKSNANKPADPSNSSTNRSANHKTHANKDSINTGGGGDCWEASAPGENVPDVIGEMPPLTEAEMSRLQWRQHQHQSSGISNKPIINKQPQQQQPPTAPRFSRDKSTDNNQSRSITGNNHVPKRYSELRNHHRQATPDGGNQSIQAPINFASPPLPPPPQQQQQQPHASYQQHLSNLMLKAPLAVAGTHVANSNAPPPPQLVSLGPMFGGDAHALSHHQQQQQQYYVYLSPATGSRLNQYSPAFTPSFPAAAGALYHHPPAQPPPQHPAPAATAPTAASPQSTPRPVLGKS